MRRPVRSCLQKGRRRYLLALLLAVCLQAALLSVALAHAELVRSDPADGAALDRAPDTVRLWFSEAIAPGFTGARVISEHGVTVPGVRVHADPNDNTLLVVNLPSLPDGVYNVAFTALSADDGHTTQGHIVFKVGAGSAPIAGAAGPSVAPADVALRWLDFVAQAGLIGSLAVALVLLSRERSGDEARVALAHAQRRVLRCGALCAVLALVIGSVALFRQASQLAESMPGTQPPPAGPLALQLLITTRTGQLWVGRQVLLVVMAANLLALSLLRGPALRRALRPAGLILAVLGAGLLAATALSGHAAALTLDAGVAVVVDWAHLVAASLWVGGLMALAIGLLPLLWPRRGTPAFATLAHAAWGPFGLLAALSVAALFATGLYNTGREVASPNALVTTFYGRALIAKIALVLLVGAIGLLNSMLLHPKVAAPLGRVLRRPAGWRPFSLAHLPGLVLAEVSLGVAVLFLSGILGSATPPHAAGSHGTAFAGQPVPQQASSGLSASAGDLRVALSAEPNLPGANVLSIRVMPAGSSPEILRVIVHFNYDGQITLGQSLGTVTADATRASPDGQVPALYQLSGSQLSLAGPWQVDVVVRRKGVEDSVAHFKWTVPAASAQKSIISDQPWEAPLTAAGLALALLVIALSIGLIVGRRLRIHDRGLGTSEQGSQHPT